MVISFKPDQHELRSFVYYDYSLPIGTTFRIVMGLRAYEPARLPPVMVATVRQRALNDVLRGQ